MARQYTPRLVNRVRAACAAVAVVAFLVFLNMNQMEDSREDLLYSVGVINSMAGQVLVDFVAKSDSGSIALLIPEPTMLGMFLLAPALMLRRRRS